MPLPIYLLSLFFIFSQIHPIVAQQFLNLDFEEINANGKPTEWIYYGSSMEDELASVHIDSSTVVSGKYSTYMLANDISGRSFAICSSIFPCDLARHKEIQISGFVKCKDITSGWAGLWCRVYENDRLLEFEDMNEIAISGTSDWKQISLKVQVDIAATKVVFGALLSGVGEAWFDNIEINLLEKFLDYDTISTQSQRYDQIMRYEDYDPVSTLKVKGRELTKAKYPFIDVHNHQWKLAEMDLKPLLASMDQINMAFMVNLSGRPYGRYESLIKAIENSKENGDRLINFTNISFKTISSNGWAEETIKQLEYDAKLGARGLKIYKELGLTIKDSDGNRIAVDDPRISPIWDKCGELGWPVFIHSAAPALFWQPMDKYNERWLEMKQFPDRRYNNGEFAPWEQIINEQRDIFRKHPNTTFINAHLGWMGNDLERLGKLLDECPNVYTELGAVIAEIGRQPVTARAFFIKYQDRILFGKDIWNQEEYYVYFRILETDDEYFDYYRKRHAFWKMYGMNLPAEVLKKIYYKNALKIFPFIDQSLFPD